MDSNTIGVILYSDEFEIVIPIVSSKSKRKLMGSYYTLTNLFPWNRSQADDIQLAILAKPADFSKDAQKVLFPLLKDLKELEDTGVFVDDKYFKFRLFTICGDNLGSNMLGGFNCHFALNSYFCRFCKESPENLLNNFNRYPLRTVNNYKEDLAESSNGVKCDSLFNKMSFYHVCLPGLPPCIAHDLLEGVVKHDLPLAIDSLVGKNYFTHETLNRNLASFGLHPNDNLVKPCSVKPHKPLSGTAAQNWSLLVLFPLIIGAAVNTSDEVWQFILLLRQVCQYVFAPALHLMQMSAMNDVIEHYLSERKRLFPSQKLRPKHHILEHYSYLYVTFGPLINVWTLRFESKHQYFIRIIKYSKNYINVSLFR